MRPQHREHLVEADCDPAPTGTGRMSSSIADSSVNWLSVHHGCPPARRRGGRRRGRGSPSRRAARSRWARPPHRRHRPRRLEELPAGLDQVGGPGADLLGVAHQHRRAGGQMVGEQRQLVGRSTGSSASMPSTGMPSASLASMSLTRAGDVGCPSRVLGRERCRAPRTSSVSSSSRHGTAIRVVDRDARGWSVDRRPRTSASR